jgi:diguanylate cyclase (GGDEF)-like protein
MRLLELESRLRSQAGRDPLTGLLNRRNFFDIFRKEWMRSERCDYPLSCIMVDIDHFKRINDTRGHIVGDEAILAAARHIEASCRASDWVCRYGGDEFCVLLPEADAEGAASWAERCRLAMAESPLADVPVTASFGVAQKSTAASSPERLLEMADKALLAAKRAGRNRVEVSS